MNVKHIGFTKLSTPSSSFLLHNVLHALHITKNLISIHKFTFDTNTSIEFHPFYFHVKDRTTGRVLLCGLSRNRLYLFPSAFNKLFSLSSVFVGECTSPTQWHSRLGHLAFHIVHHVLSKFSLPVISSKIVQPCFACFSSKSKQLSFSLSCTQINFPLDLIHSNVWGPSPICSKSSFKYYVSFVDAYRHYTWLFPMTNKSDVLPILLNGKNMLSIILIAKYKLFNLIGVVNIAHLTNFSKLVVLLIMYLVLTCFNKMVLLSTNTDILWKLV